ncbi:MAG: hypothetical protein KF734_10890 [Saprospiraceae bacterium]|nr:hypothetical protein [Saprospiraceae bacterium]
MTLPEFAALNELLVIADESLLPIQNVYSSVVRRSVAIAFSASTESAADHHLELSFLASISHDFSDSDEWGSVEIVYDSIHCSLDIASIIDKNFKESTEHIFARIHVRFSGNTLDSIGLNTVKTRAFSENFNPSIEDAKLILKYLKSNFLIVRCLQSATNISKPVREKILHEMLMPRKEEG